MPLVSVIVTTFNRKEKLKETLDSILCQSFQDFELIVVDNFSDYDFFSFINSFENDKLIPIQNNNDGIIAVNRNIGIKAAKGEFIAFCDDDDIWLPHKLTTQIDTLQNTNADFVSSNTFLFEKDINQITGKSNNRSVRNLKDFLKSNQISTSTVLVRKSKLLYFDETRTLESIEDYALWLELYISGYKFIFLEDSLIFYRYSSSNISINNWMLGHYKKIFLFSQMAIKHSNLKIEYTLHFLIIQNLIIVIAKKILHFFKLK